MPTIAVGREITLTFERARDGLGVVAVEHGSVFFPSNKQWQGPNPEPGQTWRLKIVFRCLPPRDNIYRVAPIELLFDGSEDDPRRQRRERGRTKQALPAISRPEGVFPVHFVMGDRRPIAYCDNMLCIPSRDWRRTHAEPEEGEVYMVSVDQVREAGRGRPACWFLLPVQFLGRYPDRRTAEAVTFEQDRLQVVYFQRPRNWERDFSAVANIDGLPAYPDPNRWIGRNASEGEVWLVRVVRRFEDCVYVSAVAQVHEPAFAEYFGRPEREYPPEN